MLLEQLAVDVSHDLRLPLHIPSSAATISHDAAAASAAGSFLSPSAAASQAASAAAGSASSPAMPRAPHETQSIDPDPDTCIAILSSSCLLEFLTRELKVASFTGMGR